MGFQTSKLQIVEPKYWNKFTSMDHLAAIGGFQPEVINNVLEYLYDVNHGYNFGSMINKLLVHYVENAETPFRWALIGGEERPIPLVKASLDTAGTALTATDKPGQYGASFYMWYAEDYFGATTTLLGSKPEAYVIKCKADAAQIGDLFRYEVELLTSNPAFFVPVADLVQDSLWNEGWGQVEQTLSKRGNSVHHGTHFMFENTMSLIRKNYEVPGNVLRNGTMNNPMAFAFKDLETGQTTKKWVDKQAWDFYRQFRNDSYRLDLYGKSNKLQDGSYGNRGESGNIIKSGFGLYEQMNSGNIMYYNRFSIDALLDFLAQIFIGRFKEEQRDIVMSCGEFGAIQFHKSIMAKPSNSNFFRSDYPLEDAANGKIKWNEKQFMGIMWLNGIKVTLMIDSQKDSPFHIMAHPDGGKVASYIYDIFDFGTTNGQANIMRVMQRNFEETFGYIPGMVDPFSPGGKAGNPKPVNSSVDGYSVYGMKQRGIMIKNVIKTGRFIPALYR